MAISASDVKSLREATGCGMMDCKKALTEAAGDVDKAMKILREKGLAAAEKKASRIAADGLVDIYSNENISAIIEVNSETDFVAKNEEFRTFVKGCAKTVADQNPSDIDALLKCKFDGKDVTVEEELREKILVIGENITLRRFARFEGICANYIHGDGKIGVVVKFDTNADKDNAEFTQCGLDVAMQIAAMNPVYLDAAKIPAEVIENEKQIIIAQSKNDPSFTKKPEAVIEKIVSGKIAKQFNQISLLNQEFVKDDSMTVAKYIESVAKSTGSDIKVTDFVRFEKGEGIEKKKDNFAEEIAQMTSK